MSLSYCKQIPSADCRFQPASISEYENDPWDIRISVDEAPLDEAYYFTVDNPAAVKRPIRELLETHALNPDCRSQLDVDEYPELPYLQEELIQYYTNHQNGQLTLEFHVNNNPEPGPINIDEPAEKFLSVCTYHDGSWDYRVLDLVVHPVIPEAGCADRKQFRRRFDDMFLMLLTGYAAGQGDEAYERFQEAALSIGQDNPPNIQVSSEFRTGLMNLERARLVKRSTQDSRDKTAQRFWDLQITEDGQKMLADLRQETDELIRRYEPFASVAIAPPALGVPDGFDARVQMMELDGIDCERTILLLILEDEKERLFEGAAWAEAYESFDVIGQVRDAMAFKTNFSAEILDALKQLAETDA